MGLFSVVSGCLGWLSPTRHRSSFFTGGRGKEGDNDEEGYRDDGVVGDVLRKKELQSGAGETPRRDGGTVLVVVVGGE